MKKIKFEDTELYTWDERDRSHIEDIHEISEAVGLIRAERRK